MIAGNADKTDSAKMVFTDVDLKPLIKKASALATHKQCSIVEVLQAATASTHLHQTKPVGRPARDWKETTSKGTDEKGPIPGLSLPSLALRAEIESALCKEPISKKQALIRILEGSVEPCSIEELSILADALQDALNKPAKAELKRDLDERTKRWRIRHPHLAQLDDVREENITKRRRGKTFKK